MTIRYTPVDTVTLSRFSFHEPYSMATLHNEAPFCHDGHMQMLLDMLAGLIAMLAAAALSQFGVDLHAPRHSEREIQRVQDCKEAPASTIAVAAPSDC